MSEITFGDFIMKRRINKSKTFRVMAEEMEVSPSYLSDIEKNRRYPPELPLLEKIATILELSKEEQDVMYDLAGKGRTEVSPDLPDYIMGQDIVRIALRAAKNNATVDDWQKFIDDLKKKENVNDKTEL